MCGIYGEGVKGVGQDRVPPSLLGKAAGLEALNTQPKVWPWREWVGDEEKTCPGQREKDSRDASEISSHAGQGILMQVKGPKLMQYKHSYTIIGKVSWKMTSKMQELSMWLINKLTFWPAGRRWI